TKADLDRILRATDEIGGVLGLKLSPHGPRMKVDDVIAEGVEMVRESERQYERAVAAISNSEGREFESSSSSSDKKKLA
ncbi:hypothetical protein JCM8115_000431, partial [Rhodotorula mucilaginosa]